MVDRLVEKGYVTRAVSPRDRRARVLEITDSGREILNQVQQIALEIQDEITMGLTPDEKDTLVRLLKRVSENHPK